MKTFLFSALLLTTVASAAPLTLRETLARVDAGHPWLRTRDSTTALAAARASAATSRPAPELSLEFENALGTDELRAARSLETTLQFSRAFDFATRRDARVNAATALNEADRLAWEERRLDLLAEAARRFIRVAAAEANLNVTYDLAALARETDDDLQTRAAHAAAAPGDLARSRLAVADANLAAEHAEHELLAAKQSLAALWGESAPDFERTAADLVELPPVADYASLADRISGSPAQARYAALARWRAAEEKLARATGARGEPRWAAGVRRTEASDDFGLVLGLSYAWPARPLSHFQAAEARVEHDRTLAEAEAARLDARAALFGLYQELQHARIERDAAHDVMIPAAQEWLAALEAGATAGRYGVRDLLEARNALFIARQRQVAAAASYHTTLVAIEQLIGGPATP